VNVQSKEMLGGHSRVEAFHKVCGFKQIKWENGIESMKEIEWAKPSGVAGNDFVGKEGMCQVRVYSGRGSGQVRTKTDEGRGQRFGQRLARARVATDWIQRQGQ